MGASPGCFYLLACRGPVQRMHPHKTANRAWSRRASEPPRPRRSASGRHHHLPLRPRRCRSPPRAQTHPTSRSSKSWLSRVPDGLRCDEPACYLRSRFERTHKTRRADAGEDVPVCHRCHRLLIDYCRHGIKRSPNIHALILSGETLLKARPGFQRGRTFPCALYQLADHMTIKRHRCYWRDKKYQSLKNNRKNCEVHRNL